VKVKMTTDALATLCVDGIVRTRHVSKGQILELDDVTAAKYVQGGFAEYASKRKRWGTQKPAG
jgi:hypothetical protein